MDGVRCNRKTDGQVEFDGIGEVEYNELEQRHLFFLSSREELPLGESLRNSIAIP